MKQRKTQNGQNRTKSLTSRARTTPDTVEVAHNTVKNRPTKTESNQEEARTTGGAVPVAEAAQTLGVDPKTVKRMCTSGKLDYFKTAGGHWRVSVPSIEAIRRSDTDTKNGRSSVSSPSLQHRKETLEELRLLIEEKKARGALQELQDDERQRKEQEETARQAEADESRQRQRAREAEQARRDRERLEQEQQRKADDERQRWLDAWVQAGLNAVSPALRSRLALEIQEAIEQALYGLDPNREDAVVRALVSSAVRRVIDPELQKQHAETLRLCRKFSETTNGISEDRAQRQREERVDAYLWDVMPYLQQLQTASDGIDFEGEILTVAQRIKNAIRPKLIEEAPALDYLSGPKRVRELTNTWLATELD